jgi:hypothetical protein
MAKRNKPEPDMIAQHERPLHHAIAGPAAAAIDRLGPDGRRQRPAVGAAPGLRGGPAGGRLRFFYGLLAFHLQRVDPDDSHLQAGLVGAVCGIHSLALPPLSPWPLTTPWPEALAQVAPTVMMELVRAWLPLIGAALVLHGSQALSRVFAARPQAVRRP